MLDSWWIAAFPELAILLRTLASTRWATVCATGSTGHDAVIRERDLALPVVATGRRKP
jgi:hypothetical protein